MSSWAKPGVKCVCIKREAWKEINGRPVPSGMRAPGFREIVTIKSLHQCGDLLTVKLEGFHQNARFSIQNFRPLVSKTTDVSKFTHLLNTQKIEELVQ